MDASFYDAAPVAAAVVAAGTGPQVPALDSHTHDEEEDCSAERTPPTGDGAQQGNGGRRGVVDVEEPQTPTKGRQSRSGGVAAQPATVDTPDALTMPKGRPPSARPSAVGRNRRRKGSEIMTSPEYLQAARERENAKHNAVRIRSEKADTREEAARLKLQAAENAANVAAREATDLTASAVKFPALGTSSPAPAHCSVRQCTDMQMLFHLVLLRLRIHDSKINVTFITLEPLALVPAVLRRRCTCAMCSRGGGTISCCKCQSAGGCGGREAPGYEGSRQSVESP
eukprot:GHVU01167549.1.p1 GENE.GHVU01167549.1~~GHVU01167549.1.p1  ORF type:complete len:284 (+),score=32.13 GHVU01167549.1:1952-2803(+)